MGQLIAGLHTGHMTEPGGMGRTDAKGSGILSFSLVTSFLNTLPARASVLDALDW